MQGPTLTMRIHQYSLMRDVAASQLRPRLPESLWKTAPLVVMNNFAGEEHLKLATVLFQNLFPAINVQTAKLSTCQVRAIVALLHPCGLSVSTPVESFTNWNSTGLDGKPVYWDKDNGGAHFELLSSMIPKYVDSAMRRSLNNGVTPDASTQT